MSNKNFVAVYGSLKEGFGNHRLLSDSRLIGKGVTEDHLTMYSLGSFPCITSKPIAPINVEVYEVDDITLNRLDSLEGHPTFYRRREVPIKITDPGNTDTVKAWIYFINNEDRADNEKTPYRLTSDTFNWQR
jgi:gamma-glutamylcyclotransferase (GGCT)/AIG2-like uncharacterized protein YtfP